MKLLPLANGHFAKVDDEDFESLVAMGSWCRINGYPALVKKDINNKPIFLHNVVGNAIPEGKERHHSNEDILDAQKSNLVDVTRSVHMCLATRPRSNNSSGHPGVRWHRKALKWAAEFRGKHLGLFTDQQQAIQAYVDAKHKYVVDNI